MKFFVCIYSYCLQCLILGSICHAHIVYIPILRSNREIPPFHLMSLLHAE